MHFANSFRDGRPVARDHFDLERAVDSCEWIVTLLAK